MLAESFNFSEFFGNSPAIVAVTLIFGGWIVTSIVGSITGNWRKVREAEQMAALKQSMVEKGMSAADIERVMNAGTKKAQC
jgi:hypothetical protein